jgi:hypothetical protein
VQYLPAPTQLVYAVLGVVFVAQAVGVVLMPESATRRPGALASLRPRFGLPPSVRGPMALAAPAMIGAWALVGFYGSLGPTLVRRLVGSTSPALGGLALAVLAAGGAFTVVATLHRSARDLMTLGTAALIAGVGAILLAVASTSAGSGRHGTAIALFFAGTAVAGAGFGGAFQGAIRSVMSVAEAHERAGVLSVLYVIGYMAMGLPAVLGGMRVVHAGVAATADEYGLAVMLLAALALAGTRRHAPAPAVVTSRG